MVKRVFWAALGAGAGVMVAAKVSKAAKKLAPSSLADSASGVPGRVTSAWQDFAEDVRSAAAEREFELYHVLGVDAKDQETGGR
ncbi:hypothetical protein KDL01_05125 [Actinospica durhamensis]|uniref:Secreted protein n=1 Tax=Actinospica durhamensis TaxID=1508375 RepID=A0A941EP70_9ACTN|nr:hypothetical protein [Actinospica durhamensis]MBR7832629.1 hypothetical protein [Actinospica durhamensis]